MTRILISNKEKFFDRWAPNYDFLLTSVFYQAVHKRLIEYVELPEQPNVLDLGCGTGRLLNRLATEFPALQGTGLDLSAEMLHQARQRKYSVLEEKYPSTLSKASQYQKIAHPT